MSKNKEKINNSCINIFKFLKLLYEDNAYYDNVVDIFKDTIDEKSDNNIQVNLNKFINALKVFGIKVVKTKNKYRLGSSLYAYEYTINDLKSISILSKAIENFPDEDIVCIVKDFLESLTLRMDNDTKLILSKLSSNYDFSFYYKDLKIQIEQCKKLCKDEMTFDIEYIKNDKHISTKGFANEVLYDNKTAYLKMYDIKNNYNLEIPLPNIINIVINPMKAKKIQLPVTITYKLTGRLAKTYKLKNEESSLGFDENGDQKIVNVNEPLGKLFPRLMRYSDSCIILSPVEIRNQMQQLIDETLAQYINH